MENFSSLKFLVKQQQHICDGKSELYPHFKGGENKIITGQQEQPSPSPKPSLIKKKKKKQASQLLCKLLINNVDLGYHQKLVLILLFFYSSCFLFFFYSPNFSYSTSPLSFFTLFYCTWQVQLMLSFTGTVIKALYLNMLLPKLSPVNYFKYFSLILFYSFIIFKLFYISENYFQFVALSQRTYIQKEPKKRE